MIDPKDIDIPDLLANWYGYPHPFERGEDGCAWLPDPLNEWYGFAGCWMRLLSGAIRVYDPQRIRVERGKAVFMADSTGDWFWAFDARDGNSVYEAELRGEWKLVPEPLSEFLVHVTLVAVGVSADFARICPQVPNDFLPIVLDEMDEIGFGGWRWPRPGHRIYMSGKLIADVGPAMDFRAPRRNREGFSSVTVSGMDQEYLRRLDGIPSVKWIAHPSGCAAT